MDQARLSVSTQADTNIVMCRDFAWPRERVWHGLMDAGMQRRWLFSPQGWEMTMCEFDATVGGEYLWVWKNEQANPVMSLRGVILEVESPFRIEHTQIMEWNLGADTAHFDVRIELSEKGGVTRMELTMMFETRAERDAALRWKMELGMEAGYSRLEEIWREG
jgi:uncharacterized protein YndB with AHSA1/START domain